MVEKAWYTTGMSGFKVWKFALRRVADQAPPPWTIHEVSFTSYYDYSGASLTYQNTSVLQLTILIPESLSVNEYESIPKYTPD